MNNSESETLSRNTERLLLLLACVATGLAKYWVSAERTVVGYGDLAHYTTLARNLAQGEGMWVNYIATWLSEPDGLPVQGASYWMPMPALIASLGMLVAGSTSFVAGKLAIIVLTSVAPLITYGLARELWNDRRLGLLGAWLTAFLHAFLYTGAVPVTHGPALVFGAGSLWAIAASLRDRRYLPVAGILIAMAQLNRADGVFWWLALIVCFRFAANARKSWLALWPAALGYSLAMAPFWIYNSLTLGSPMPGSLMNAALLTNYSELYFLPEQLSLERYLDQGPLEILQQKLGTAGKNSWAFLTGLATGGERTGGKHLHTYGPHILVTLFLLGSKRLLRRELLGFWVYALATFALYTVVFTHSGRTSFRAVMFALYPIQILCAAGSLLWILDRIFVHKPKIKLAAGIASVLLFAAIGLLEAKPAANRKAAAAKQMQVANTLFLEEVIRPAGLEDSLLLVSHDSVHALHAHTGLRVASIPLSSESELRAAASRIGATHLVIDDQAPKSPDWNTLEEIRANPAYTRVVSKRMGKRKVEIYRLP